MIDDLHEGRIYDLRSKWGWFLAVGVIFLICGVVALGNLMIATVASVYFVGGLMLAAGIVHLVHAVQVKGWERVLFWALSGVLYTLAAFMIFDNPLLASAVLTLLIGVALVLAGAVRVWIGVVMKGMPGWGWIVASGVVTVLAGLVIAAGWPVDILFILGLFLALDLIVQGSSLVAFGLSMRR